MIDRIKARSASETNLKPLDSISLVDSRTGPPYGDPPVKPRGRMIAGLITGNQWYPMVNKGLVNPFFFWGVGSLRGERICSLIVFDGKSIRDFS